jgi:hypothetical protein
MVKKIGLSAHIYGITILLNTNYEGFPLGNLSDLPRCRCFSEIPIHKCPLLAC